MHSQVAPTISKSNDTATAQAQQTSAGRPRPVQQRHRRTPSSFARHTTYKSVDAGQVRGQDKQGNGAAGTAAKEALRNHPHPSKQQLEGLEDYCVQGV